jgi:hypothetical protein
MQTTPTPNPRNQLLNLTGSPTVAFDKAALDWRPDPSFQLDAFVRAAEAAPPKGSLEAALQGVTQPEWPTYKDFGLGEVPAMPDVLKLDLTWAYNYAATQMQPLPQDGSPEESEAGRRARAALARVAKRASAGRRPDGRCYNHVWKFLSWIGSYGRVVQRGIPASHADYAKQFAYLVNPNPAAYGLRKLNLDNPYMAPEGAIVVVRPGTPGTGHPTAGDIAIADGNGRFYNGGEMGYGGPRNFPPGNRHVLGIYVPL